MAFGAIMGQTPDLTNFVKKTGDTLTGPLLYDGVPSVGTELVNKDYVDNFKEEDKVEVKTYYNNQWLNYKKTTIFNKIFLIDKSSFQNFEKLNLIDNLILVTNKNEYQHIIIEQKFLTNENNYNSYGTLGSTYKIDLFSNINFQNQLIDIPLLTYSRSSTGQLNNIVRSAVKAQYTLNTNSTNQVVLSMALEYNSNINYQTGVSIKISTFTKK